MELLQARKSVISFHDPYVDVIPPTREHAAFNGMASVTLSKEVLAAQDAVVVVTDHANVDYDLIARHAKLVIDTRNALGHIAPRFHVVKA